MSLNPGNLAGIVFRVAGSKQYIQFQRQPFSLTGYFDEQVQGFSTESPQTWSVLQKR